ncbi:MAG: PRC-barrel domain-containing protein [Syntrophobacteraceae bacterium]
MVTRQDENLGKIHELVIDAEDGRMVCVAPSIGGFMGMVNKLFALPWKAFEVHVTEHRLTLNCLYLELYSAKINLTERRMQ